MKAGDTEATQGLERAKSGALKKPEGDPKFVYAPPKLVSDQPVPPPARAKEKADTAEVAVPSNGPKRPSSPRIAIATRNETTSTRTAPTVQVDTSAGGLGSSSGPPSSTRSSRSAPPPLPSHASSRPTDMGSLTATGSAVSTVARPPADSVLESEIDASLDRLELEGPTGTTLPGEEAPAKSLLDQSSALSAVDPMPSTLDAKSDTSRGTRPPMTFNVGTDEATHSAQAMPHTIRDSVRARDALGTDRPLSGDDSFHSPATEGVPVTAEDPAATGESPVTHEEEIGSGELVDVDDPTGAGMQIDPLESTHAAAKRDTTHAGDDEIVIADDLAEEVEDEAMTKGAEHAHPTDDDEEHTDAGSTVPPFRGGT
jgi:hypothetical protein